MGLFELYVSVITWASRSGDRCFRTDDIERRTRKVKRASNWTTARSSRRKLDLMSAKSDSVGAMTDTKRKSRGMHMLHELTCHGFYFGVRLWLLANFFSGLGVVHSSIPLCILARLPR